MVIAGEQLKAQMILDVLDAEVNGKIVKYFVVGKSLQLLPSSVRLAGFVTKKKARCGESGLERNQVQTVYFASASIRPSVFGLPHPLAKS
jgi:hypothetical protein